MIQQERERGERIERMAHSVCRSVCRTHYGYASKQDPKYLEVFSLGQLAVCNLLEKYPHIGNKKLFKLARKRVVHKLAYKGEVINKTKHFVKKDLEAAEAAGEFDCNHYLHQQTPDSYTDEDGDSRKYEYFETNPEYDSAPDPLHIANGDGTDREILRRLTETQQTCNQIANALGISDHHYKKRSKQIKQNAISREPMSSRKPRTADPKILRKVQPLAHDKSCKPGCPVTRMKSFSCETALDELLIDLFRDDYSIERIANQINQHADWVKNRLGIIAYRCIVM